MQCECLLCDKPATARFTAPHLKPRFFICETHLEEQLAWAGPYRTTPGLVQIEAVAR